MDAIKELTPPVDDQVNESGNTGCHFFVEKRIDAQYSAFVMILDARKKSVWNDVDISRHTCRMTFVLLCQSLISRDFEECRVMEY
jgi:hypothetical protein